MTPEQLADAVRGCLPAGSDVPVDVVRHRGAGPGTWTTPVAVRLAGRDGDPTAVAAELATRLRAVRSLAEVQVLPAGHLALTPSPAAATATALAVGRVVPSTRDPRPLDDVPDDLGDLRRLVVARCRERLRDARPAAARPGAGRVAGVHLVPRPRRAPTGAQVLHRFGSDAVVHALLRERPDRPVELSTGTPSAVRTVQRAHARAARAVRAGEALGRPATAATALDGPGEPPLLAAVADHARVVGTAAVTGDPHRLVRHLDDVAALVHHWIDLHPWPGGDPAGPQGSDDDTTRLGLAISVRAVLADGLGLLGATAPERV